MHKNVHVVKKVPLGGFLCRKAFQFRIENAVWLQGSSESHRNLVLLEYSVHLGQVIADRITWNAAISLSAKCLAWQAALQLFQAMHCFSLQQDTLFNL